MRAWTRCPHCGHRHASLAEFCPVTGKPLPPAPLVPWRALSWQLSLAVGGLLLIILGAATLLSSSPHNTVSLSQTPAAFAGLRGSAAAPARINQGSSLTPRPAVPPLGRIDVTPSDTPAQPLKATSSETPTSVCPGALAPRLTVGHEARVSPDPPQSNRVRSGPGRGEGVIGHILPGQTFRVLDGPACADGVYWWYVRTDRDGLTGWTAEGDLQTYWLEEITPTPRSWRLRLSVASARATTTPKTRTYD